MEFDFKEVSGDSLGELFSVNTWNCAILKVVMIFEHGGKIDIHGEEIEFKPYSLVFIPKDIQLRAVAGEPRPFFLLYFSESFFDRMVMDFQPLQQSHIFSGENLFYRTVIIPEKYSGYNEFMAFHMELAKQNSNELIYKEFGLTLVKQVLLTGNIYLDDFVVVERKGRMEEIELSNKFRCLISKHVHQEKKIPFYTEQLGVSQRKLTSVTKKVFGKTPKELISIGMLKISKQLLVNSNKSIKEIARELQYEDENNFSACFSKLCGESPKTYRKRWSKDAQK